jgi:hypothetical protein
MARTIKTPGLEFSVSTEYTPCDDILFSDMLLVKCNLIKRTQYR